MRKLGLTLLAVALSTPFTFAQAPAQPTSSSQPQTAKTAKHKAKHHKKHGAKANTNTQPMVK